jgi:hypothetical protein
MTTTVEISVRTFHTSDDMDVTPKISIVVDIDELSGLDLSKLVAVADSSIASLPDDIVLRPMTKEEVKAYRSQEKNED